LEVDVRLVCATNMPIHDMVSQNRFRQDLLYRINTVEIRMPTLRERPEDVPLLLSHFLKVYCKKYNRPLKKVSPGALKKLEKYHWPGNVRELQHAIERSVIMSESNMLQAQDFFLFSPEKREDRLAVEDFNLEKIEKLAIGKAVAKHKGNISHAAKELGISRTALYRRLEKYGL
jgi:transcriptional regulator with PAS, ATPase and Fis domain